MAQQTSQLVGQNQPQLNSLLPNLHSVLGVVSQHQLDLAEGLSYLASGLKGFASVGYSGPNELPEHLGQRLHQPGDPGRRLRRARPVRRPRPGPQRGARPRPAGVLRRRPARCRAEAAPGTGLEPRAPRPSALGGSARPSSGVGGLAQLLEPLTGATPVTTSVDQPTKASLPCRRRPAAARRTGGRAPAVALAVPAPRRGGPRGHRGLRGRPAAPPPIR